jgi:6-phosphogluconate dehydrogenase
MQLAMVGLGRMGANMARRLVGGGISVIGFDTSTAARAAYASSTEAAVATRLDELIAALRPPRIIWAMLPAGDATGATIDALGRLLEDGDVVVDGGNAYYRDTQQRASGLAERGIGFVDAGVSGGIWGLEQGYGLMVGGNPDDVRILETILDALAPDPPSGEGGRTWVHCGPVGSGHYAKMVHNGIEYGLMQAYAEGLALLAAKPEFALDVAAIARAWRHGTVIRSWLLDLTAQALARNPSLADIAPRVADSGEGRWTVAEALDLGIPTPVIGAALAARFSSQGSAAFSDRVLAAMRAAFGGHAVEKAQPGGEA